MVGLTVRDLVEDPALGIDVAVLGAGIDTPVRWAHSTELLDPRPYLRGGEVVLTVGSGLTGPERCIAFVEVLAECGAAALGLGVGDVHAAPPDALREACASTGLPLLLIPPTTPFIQITELLADFRVRMAADRSNRATVGRLLDAVSRRGAAPDLLLEDVRAAQLSSDHLVASAWPQDRAADLERWFADRPHLIGDVDGVSILITSEVRSPASASAALGSPYVLSRAFVLADIVPRLAETLHDWSIAHGSESERDAVRRRSGDESNLALLVRSLPAEALTPLLTELIEPIEAHDRTSGSRLLESLRSFLEHDGSVQAAARTLHLHPNSLRHRLMRVNELTGKNPLLFRDQVDLAIALEARRHQDAGRRGG